MFVDIHTHIDNQAVIRILDDNFEENVLTTWGIHPWDVIDFNLSQISQISQKWATKGLSSLKRTDFTERKICENPCNLCEIYAIGEVGLDKVHKETFEKQVEVFEEMIRFSESYRKPMIVHCVRAYSEIIEIRKKTKATMPWVIHGFNSSVETMRQLLRYDMYISLGEVLYRNENQAVKILKNIPLDRLFLETDVSGRNIKDVYEKAAVLMGCEIDFLCRQIFKNYGRLEAAH